jgi:hypothetical protein
MCNVKLHVAYFSDLIVTLLCAYESVFLIYTSLQNERNFTPVTLGRRSHGDLDRH